MQIKRKNKKTKRGSEREYKYLHCIWCSSTTANSSMYHNLGQSSFFPCCHYKWYAVHYYWGLIKKNKSSATSCVALYLFHINASQGANLWQRLGVYPFMEGHTHEQWEIVLVSALFISMVHYWLSLTQCYPIMEGHKHKHWEMVLVSALFISMVHYWLSLTQCCKYHSVPMTSMTGFCINIKTKLKKHISAESF